MYASVNKRKYTRQSDTQCQVQIMQLRTHLGQCVRTCLEKYKSERNAHFKFGKLQTYAENNVCQWISILPCFRSDSFQEYVLAAFWLTKIHCPIPISRRTNTYYAIHIHQIVLLQVLKACVNARARTKGRVHPTGKAASPSKCHRLKHND